MADQGLQESELGKELPELNGDALSVQPILVVQNQGTQRKESAAACQSRYIEARLGSLFTEESQHRQPTIMIQPLDFREELMGEYNSLRKDSSESARRIILRCAEILEQLGELPLERICSRLAQDLPYADRYVREILPEKYKLASMVRIAEETPQNLLPRHELIIALETVAAVAEDLVKVSTGMLKKIMEDKDRLTKLEGKVNAREVSRFLADLKQLQNELAGIAELTDDRVIITLLEQASIKLRAKTDSLRHIASSYHELKQEEHGPLSAKRIAQIVKS